jgi:hypothetical protein
MHIHGSSLLVDILGSYVMVSTKVRRGLQRRLEGLGLTYLSFCGGSLRRRLRGGR